MRAKIPQLPSLRPRLHEQAGLARSWLAPQNPRCTDADTHGRDTRAQAGDGASAVLTALGLRAPCIHRQAAGEHGHGAGRERLPEALEPLGRLPASCVSFSPKHRGREGHGGEAGQAAGHHHSKGSRT